jgi:hypothetical protein
MQVLTLFICMTKSSLVNAFCIWVLLFIENYSDIKSSHLHYKIQIYFYIQYLQSYVLHDRGNTNVLMHHSHTHTDTLYKATPHSYPRLSRPSRVQKSDILAQQSPFAVHALSHQQLPLGPLAVTLITR